MSAAATASRCVPQVPGVAVGQLCGLEFAFEFLLWAQQRSGVPEWRAIAARWHVSRATAYRYRAAYARFLARYRARQGGQP